MPPFGTNRRSFDIEGRPVRKPGNPAPEAGVVTMSPQFFETVGVQLRRGRITDNDGAPGAENVIVSERFAAQYFTGEDPIGRRIKFTVATPAPGQPAPPVQMWRTIVGVDPTIRHSQPQDAEPLAVIYRPYRQDPPAGVTLLVRSRLDAGAIMNAVRQEVQAVDPSQPVFTIRTMDQMMTQLTWPYRVFGSLFAIFAVIALVMSAVGLYAVMAYSVTQRTMEIGVRMALGADGSQVSWLILKRGLLQLGLGLAIGLAGAFGLSRVLSTLLVHTAYQSRSGPAMPLILAMMQSPVLMPLVLPAHRSAGGARELGWRFRAGGDHRREEKHRVTS